MDASKRLVVTISLLGFVFGCCWIVQGHGNDEQDYIYNSSTNAVVETSSLKFDINGLARMPTKVVRVDQFGGKGDGKSDDTTVIS